MDEDKVEELPKSRRKKFFSGHQVEPRSSWIALFCVFFVNSLTSSAETSFGILYDYFIEKYDTNRSTIGWLLSVYTAAGALAGLFCSSLVVQHGCRVTFILGLLFSAVGVTLSAVVPNTVLLTITFGVFAGAGFGICLLSSATVIQQCFESNRGMANGISALGYTAGNALSPIIINYFLGLYGLTGALVLYGALYVQGILFAMFINSPDKYIASKVKKHHRAIEMRPMGNGSSKVLQTEEKLSEAGDNSGLVPKETMEDQDGRDRNQTVSEENEIACPETVEHSPNSIIEDGGEHVSQRRSNRSGPNWLTKAKKGFLKMFDFTFFENPAFLCVFLCYLFLRICRFGLLGQLVGAAIHQGLSPEQAAKIVPAIGVGSLVTRLLSAVLLNFKWMNPVIYIIPGILFMGATSFVSLGAHSYRMHVTSFTLMGLAQGIYTTVDPLVVLKVVGVRKFPRAYSINRVMMIPGPLLVVPFTGWLFDEHGDYESTFIFLAVCSFVSAGFALAVYFLLRYSNKDGKK